MSDDLDPKVAQAFKQLTDNFPARYRVKATLYLRALLMAIAEGDGYIDGQVDAVADNSLVVTASGKYLDRLGSIRGASRGRATGVQDDDFRKLIPVIGSNPKQIISTLQKIIDYIYGPYASHANTTCSAPAPYNLSNGAKLRVRVDDKELDIYFKDSDASSIEAVTAQEVATAISDRTKGKIIGSVITNVRTGEQFVNMRTSTIGSQGFVQVLGGDAQSSLRFPEIRPTRQAIGQYDVKRYNGTDEMEYQCISGVSPACRTAGIRINDLVTISQASGFQDKNCGTFKVSFVNEDSFRVINPNGVPESSVTNLNTDDFVFYRPDLGNILLNTRPATILHTGQRELTVILPVTSPIVKRTLKGSHHFHSGISNVISATEDTMTLASPSGFSTSGNVHRVGNREMAEGSVSSVSGTNITMISGDGWPSSGAVYSPTERKFFFYKTKNGNILGDVFPTPPVSLAGTVLKYAKKYSYTGIEGSKLTGVRPDPTDSVGHDVTSEANIVDKFPGGFIYDLNAAYSISDKATNIEEKIQQGSSRTVVRVGDVSEWDNDGYFMIAYGTKEEEGPIRYLNKVGQEALIIDPGHVFERDHLKGISIRRIRKLGPAIPRVNGEDLPVYMTGTSQARTLLADYLRSIVAAGVVLKFKIIVPEQKWPVLPLLYSTDPLLDDLAIVQPEDNAVGGNALPPSAPPAPTPILIFDPVVVPAPPEPEPDNGGGGDTGGDGGGTDPNAGFVAPVLTASNKRFTTSGWAFRAELSWPEIPGATAYRIWKNGTGFTTNTIIEITTAGSYTDYEVFVNNSVSYQIQAIKGSNLTGFQATPLSNTVSVFIDPGAELETTTVPTLVANYNSAQNRIYLKNQLPDTMVTPFSFIRYFRGEVVDGVEGSATQIFPTNAGNDGVYDFNITVGKTYFYYYVHTIGAHDSQQSNHVVMTVGGQAVTLQMQGNVPTFNEVGLLFSCNAIPQGSAYELWMGTSVDSVAKQPGTMTISGSQFTYNVNSGLNPNTQYFAKVVVKSSTGTVLKESSIVNATTVSRPNSPSGITSGAYDSSDGGVPVNWTVPSDSTSWVNISESATPNISAGVQQSSSGVRLSSDMGKILYVHVWSDKIGLLSTSPVSSQAIKLITSFATLQEVSHTPTTLNISTFSPSASGQVQGPVHGATSMTLKVYKWSDNSLIKTLTGLSANLNNYQITGLPSGEPVMIEFSATNGTYTYTSQKFFFNLN